METRVIKDSILRLPLSESVCRGEALEYTGELRDALCPAFFASQEFDDRGPIHLKLPDRTTARLPFDHARGALLGDSRYVRVWGMA